MTLFGAKRVLMGHERAAIGCASQAPKGESPTPSLPCSTIPPQEHDSRAFPLGNPDRAPPALFAISSVHCCRYREGSPNGWIHSRPPARARQFAAR